MLNHIQHLMSISDPEELHRLDESCTQPFRVFFFWKDLGGSYIGCNDAMAQLLGFDKGQDLLGYTDFDLCWADSADSFRENDNQVIFSETPRMLIESGTLIDGKKTSALSYKLPLRSRSQKVTGVICMAVPFDSTASFPHCPHDGNVNQAFDKDIPDAYNLTKRQKECLYYLVRGMTIKEIARKLNLSARTVEHYIEIIKAKLNCHTRSQLISKILGT